MDDDQSGWSWNQWAHRTSGCDCIQYGALFHHRFGQHKPILFRNGLHRNMIDIKELYWAAGFIEGEGSFSSTLVTPSRAINWRIMIGVVQVQRQPLERLERLFGGSIGVKSEASGSHSKTFVWFISGRKAAAIAMTLWSILSPRRREQIELMISRWKGNRTQAEAGLSRRGEGHYNVKLTAAQVTEIRAQPDANKQDLADRYGVTRQNIDGIRRRKSWRNLQ